jgi:hypothetical protein
MGEVFATATGAAGLASLGIQTFDGIISLRSLFERIADAPKRARDLFSELNSLANILKDIDAPDPSQEDHIHSAGLRDAIIRCSELQTELKVLLAPVLCKSRSSPIPISWRDISFAIKDKHVEDLISRIERVKASITLAVPIQYVHTNSARSENVTVEVLASTDPTTPCAKQPQPALGPDSLQEGTSHIHSSVIKQKPKQSPLTTSVTLNMLFGKLTIATNKASDKNAPSEDEPAVTRYQFTFASIISNRSIAMLVKSLSYGRVRRVLSSARLVPDTSLIFKLCEIGDTLGVQQLIADGEASPFDTTRTGQTPLLVRTLL